VAAVGLQLKADAEGDRTAGEGIGTMRELRAPHLDRLRRKDAYIVDLPAAGEAAIEARDRTLLIAPPPGISAAWKVRVFHGTSSIGKIGGLSQIDARSASCALG
jgi:hypothetical protein